MSQTNQTTYFYDGRRVIQERVSGAPTVSYTRGNDLSGSLEGAGGIGGLLARSSGYSSGNWTTNNFYFADGNGNVTYMINSSQSMVASYRYDPFGNTISSSGTLANANVYRFSSKEIHTPSGLYYYLYRFYDPTIQRWINRDPIGEWGGNNLFRFAMNNPLFYVDLFGLDPTLFSPGSTSLTIGNTQQSNPSNNDDSDLAASATLKYSMNPAACLILPKKREWWEDWKDRVPTNAIPPWRLPSPFPKDWRLAPAGGDVKGIQLTIPWP